jgi:hypothetical protein
MSDLEPVSEPKSPVKQALVSSKKSPAALAITSDEEKKPWYKEAANLISGVALVVAIVAIFQTHYEHKNHELENLQQAAVEIVENQKALNELPSNQSDAVVASNIQSFLIQKGNTLASRGIELSKHYGANATPEVLFVIGYQAAASGYYLDAEELYKRAMDKADSPLAKSGPQLALARLCFTEGNPHFSIEKGEQLYRDALVGMTNSKDSAIVYETGYLYETWAAAEFENGKTSEGLEKLADSERAYRSLPMWNGSRAIALLRLSQTQSRMLQASDQGQELAKQIAGDWVSLGPTEGSLTGKLSINLSRDSGQLSASFLQKLNGLDSLGPKIQVSGPITMVDSHSAVFAWQGSDSLSTISGKTNLAFSNDLVSISAEELRPGQSSLRYKFVRAK